ncbi:hypothetical protein GF342_04050 [Candidatus Woesearchaeota archaeon]|nr:hypothetical protein [Candidatus Woesearchaeota archaeon]
MDCCPPFNPTRWNEKEHTWKNKRFIKDTVRTFFFVPLNFGPVIQRMTARVKNEKGAAPDWLCLADHRSRWKMDLYLAVNKPIPGAVNVLFNGTFLSKVYEGPFKDAKKWKKDFQTFAHSKKKTVKKLYFWYTTCPTCAKKYGKNYVVIIAEVNHEKENS